MLYFVRRSALPIVIYFIMSNLWCVEAVRVTPVPPTPQPASVQLSIVFPKNQSTVKKMPLGIQMRLRGFPLGVLSQFKRAKEIRNSKLGQAVHVFIDDFPYFALNNEYEYTFNQTRVFYDRILNYEVPYKILPGKHLLRAIPCRSFGECLKDPGAFAYSIFSIEGESSDQELTNFNLESPFLTYNEPQGHFQYSPGKPLLLDFYLSNCRLSQDGYKVKLRVDGKEVETLTRWTPYYLYGLSKGKHEIELELLDQKGGLVPNQYTHAKRTITLY